MFFLSRVNFIQTLPLQTWRSGAWTTISTEKLVPGDIISLTRGVKGADEVVPCDCLLLHGSAVANEATLTGIAGQPLL